MAKDHKERLVQFAQEISQLEAPMGSDFETGCWGARAYATARAHGADPCDYFGISRKELDEKITINASLAPSERNAAMARETKKLAATR